MKKIIPVLLILLLLMGGCKKTLPDVEDAVNDLPSFRPEAEKTPVADEPALEEPLPTVQVGEESVSWVAMVRTVEENGFLANHLKNPDYGLFYCWPGENTRWINASGPEALQMGDLVAITFDGCVDESYPAGLHRPLSVERLENPGESLLEEERKRLEKNTLHVYDFRVILKEYPGYGYSEIPLKELPDFSAVEPISVVEERRKDLDPKKDYGAIHTRVFYLQKKARTVGEALGILKELMSVPEVLQAWAVPAAT